MALWDIWVKPASSAHNHQPGTVALWVLISLQLIILLGNVSCRTSEEEKGARLISLVKMQMRHPVSLDKKEICIIFGLYVNLLNPGIYIQVISISVPNLTMKNLMYVDKGQSKTKYQVSRELGMCPSRDICVGHRSI